MVLINLATLRRAALPQLLEAAWRLTAPERLIQAFDGVVTPPTRNKASPGREDSTGTSAQRRGKTKT